MSTTTRGACANFRGWRGRCRDSHIRTAASRALDTFDDFVATAALPAERLGDTLARHGLLHRAQRGLRHAAQIITVARHRMWWLTIQRERALWWYNRVFMPLGLRFSANAQL